MSSLIGFNTLSNNLPAFIVATRDTLIGDYFALLLSNNCFNPNRFAAPLEPATFPLDAKLGNKMRRLNISKTDIPNALSAGNNK